MAVPDDNASDELLDGIVTHQVNLLRVAAGQREQVLSMLEALEVKLESDLQNTVGKTPHAIARLTALKKQTSGTISDAYKQIADANGKALSEIATLEASKTVQVLNSTLGVAIATVGQTPDQLAAIAGKTLVAGKYPKEWWASQSKALQDKFANQMREGMLKGEGVDKLVDRVRGTKAAGYVDGIMAVSKAQATALVRTSVISTANEARIQTIMGQGNVVKGIQWVATLDARTTPICQALDGKQWSVPDLNPVGHDKAFPGPTAHWQCRSTQIPVTRSWAELANKPVKTDGMEGKYQEILKAKLEKAGMSPEAVKAAIGEQAAKLDGNGTSGTVTFEKWLGKQSDAKVDSILGTGKAQLWKDGKVTVTQMTDQDNRPLTVGQLKAAVHANNGAPLPETMSPAKFSTLPPGSLAGYTDPQAAVKAAQKAAAEAAAKAAALAAEKAAAEAAKQSAAMEYIQEAYGKFDDESTALMELDAANADARVPLSPTEMVDKAKAIALEKGQKKAAKEAAEALAATEAAKKAELLAAAAAQKAAEEAAAQTAALLAKNNAAQQEIGDVLANPKGKTLLAKNLGKLMKEQPGMDPHELLEQAKAQAIADQAKASQAAALSGYKQKFLAGQSPTPAQVKALEGMEPAAKQKFLDGISAAKKAAEEKLAKELAEKAAQEAALKAAEEAARATAAAEAQVQREAAARAAAAPVPAVPPPPAGFPADPEKLKVVKKLGGTTGAELVQDTDGTLYVRKRGASPAHLREEVTADNLYRALGANVPEAQLYTTANGPVKLARFVEGKNLSDFLAAATPAKQAAVLAELRGGFAMDALMGNWDVVGTSMDNVLVDAKGTVWRIDNGGSLRFRAQGTAKLPSQWNEHPTDMWTMRGKQYVASDVPTLAGNVKAFGGLDVFDLGRQIEKLDPAALAVAPPELRPVLEARLANMQAFGRKALAYEADGLQWKAETVDEITRHMAELRVRGITGALPKQFTNTGTTVVDENGLPWDHLRTKGAAGPVSAPAPTLAPGDTIYDKALQGVKTYGFNGAKGLPPNATKVQGALDLIPTLKQKAAVGEALAKHYLPALEELEKNYADLLAGKGYKPLAKLEPFKLPAAAVPVSAALPALRNQSLVADVAEYMKTQGGDYKLNTTWQASQASHSWYPQALGFKWWHAVNQELEDSLIYWGAESRAAAKVQFEAMAKAVGLTPAAAEKTLRIQAAFVQEVLGNVDFKWNDQERDLVRLMRTEHQDAMKASKVKIGDYGEHTIKKGVNESHSIFQRVGVHGTELTIQAVPHTRVTGLYWLERGPGMNYASFAGDGENEFTANTNGLPFVYAKTDASGLSKPEDFRDASKWGLPLNYFYK